MFVFLFLSLSEDFDSKHFPSQIDLTFLMTHVDSQHSSSKVFMIFEIAKG